MSIEEAERIRMDFGKFLEVSAGRLNAIFGGEIPEFLLPHPKKKIEEALDVCIEHCISNGDKEAAQMFDSTRGFLIAFVDDEQAIRSAAKRFSNQEFMKTYLKRLREGWESERT